MGIFAYLYEVLDPESQQTLDHHFQENHGPQKTRHSNNPTQGIWIANLEDSKGQHASLDVLRDVPLFNQGIFKRKEGATPNRVIPYLLTVKVDESTVYYRDGFTKPEQRHEFERAFPEPYPLESIQFIGLYRADSDSLPLEFQCNRLNR